LCARISLVVLGAASVTTQLVCLREVLSTFGGNELAAGVALGSWLFLTGLGSYVGSRMIPGSGRGATQPEERDRLRAFLIPGHLLLAVLPLGLLTALRALPLVAGVRGQMLGLSTALWAGLITFLPFGLVSGGMIPLAGRLLAAPLEESPSPDSPHVSAASRAYVFDSLGSAGGGLLFSLLLVHLLSHGWSLAVFGWLNLVAAVLLAFGRPTSAWPASGQPALGRRDAGAAAVLTIALAALLSALLLLEAGPVDRASLSWRFPGQTILLSRSTPFAQIVVTRTGQQENVFQDAIPLYSSGDLTAEARVHPAMIQAPEHALVLLIGGGVFGALKEIEKYAPARIDYLELDRAIFDQARRRNSAIEPVRSEGAGKAGAELDRPNIRAIVGDGRRLIRKAGEQGSRYDVILLDLPGPQNAGLNRYYTEEFFRETKAALSPNGVLSFHLPATPNYIGAEQLAMERSIFHALRASFSKIAFLPGAEHVVLASESALDLDLERLLPARGIATTRLLDYDWTELSDPFRREELAALLRVPGPPDRDLSPTAFGHLLALETRISGQSRCWTWALASISMALAALATAGRPARLAVGTSGFAAMALELEVMLIFQVLFGHLYLRMSLLISLFLVGAAGGAILSPRLGLRPGRQIMVADGVIVLIALLIPAYGKLATSTAGAHLDGAWGQIVLPTLVLVPAAIIGGQFAAAAAAAATVARPKADQGGTAVLGRLYLADLSGAAFGTILTGLILIPLLGLAGVTLAVVLLKLISLAVSLAGQAGSSVGQADSLAANERGST
jgi:spermidine synthase